MGRPLFTASASPVGSVEMRREDNVEVAMAGEQGPRTWCESDADPDEEAWWNTKQIFVESFTTGPVDGGRGTSGHAGRLEAPMAGIERDTKIEQKDEIQIDTDFSKLFPARYTISEEELAKVTLDTVESDGEDDYELAWDDADDMDIDVEAVHSDVSTPAPSTPVGATRIVSLPISVPSTPEPTRRRTLPVSISSTTPINIGTPIRQNSYHAHTPSMSPIPTSSSITTRSVARVRGFAVHSPRTELVL